MTRYTRVTFHGATVDKYTRAALQACERDLGYELTIVQGSYHGGVSASAGTHDGGGTVDLAPYDHTRKVKALRSNGFAAWYRYPIPGLWGAHIHAVQIGNKKASRSAKNQVSDYYNGLNGLANRGRDTEWRPKTITQFVYGAKPTPSTVTTSTPEGLFGMREPRVLTRTKVIKLKKGKHRIIPLMNKYKGGSSLLWNPTADASFTSNFYISGIENGSSVAARYVIVKGKSNKVISSLPIVELGGTTGKDHDQMTGDVSLRKGERLRVQLTAYQDGVEVYYSRHYVRWI